MRVRRYAACDAWCEDVPDGPEKESERCLGLAMSPIAVEAVDMGLSGALSAEWAILEPPGDVVGT